MSFEDQSLIIFNGPPGSGKDEACNFMSSQYGFIHLEFKQELFLEVFRHFNVSEEWFMGPYHDQKIKTGQKESALGNRTRREALIYLSEEVIKPVYGNDFFGLKIYEKINQVSSYCFSDGGFIEEVEVLINKLGSERIAIVQLYRDGCDFSYDSRKYINGHHQKSFILGHSVDEQKKMSSHAFHKNLLPIRTYRVFNNGSIGEFHRTIRKIIGRERNANKGEKI